MMTRTQPLISMCLAALAAACGPSGGAPVVDPLSNQIVAVNEELVLRINGRDPDGDGLTYSFESDVPDIRSRSSLTQLPVGAGEFRWTPMAADVGTWYFDFNVSDGGHTATVTVEIDVRSAVGDNSAPAFLEPLGRGTTLDLSKESCLDLGIILRDYDSVDVKIAEEEPLIAEATLDQTSGLTADWKWCPTAKQISGGDRFTLTLSADDGNNPKTTFRYLIVLRKEPKKNCPGEGPVIVHNAVDLDTVATLKLRAEISDDVGLKDAPYLYYSLSPPSNPPNLGDMALVPMQLVSGSLSSGTWEALVPNPTVGGGASSPASLYYLIIARDDDNEGNCDHETIAPDDSSYAVTVTNPGGPGNQAACEMCSADIQCGSTNNDLCVRVAGDPVCLQACGSGNSCPGGYTCSPSAVESVDGTSGRVCVPDGDSCQDDCVDDQYEDNDSISQAKDKSKIAVGNTSATVCPIDDFFSDDDYWQFTLAEASDVTLSLSGSNSSDLDIMLRDEAGNLIANPWTDSSNETIRSCLDAGTYYVHVWALYPSGPAQNDYNINFSVTPGCDLCADDREPDDDPDAATEAVTFDDLCFYEETRSICTADIDYHSIYAVDGETIWINVIFPIDGFFDGKSGDLDIELLDNFGSVVAYSETTNDDEHLEYLVNTGSCAGGCLYYLRIYGYAQAENLYDVKITVDEAEMDLSTCP